MSRTLPRFGLLILATGLVLAVSVAALAVPVGLLGRVATGEPAPIPGLGTMERRSYVYAVDGSPLALLRGEVNREPVELADVPEHVVAAILAVEDAGFWGHDGIDGRGLLRALSANIGSGDIAQGGSTITQQLVKLRVVGRQQTLDRKVQEMVLARRLEQEMSKEEILSQYLNTVYFGNSAYGIQAAAETYYGVSVGDLDIAQAAFLAGIIGNPSAYNPVRFPERATQRRDQALERMQAEGVLTDAETLYIRAVPVPTQVHQVIPPPDDYFIEEVKQTLLDDEENRFGLGDTREARQHAVFSGGLRIHTTFDPRAQQLALTSRDQHLGQGGLFDIGPAINPETGQPFVDPVTNEPMVNPETGEPLTLRGTASIVSVEPATGAVRAMVGGPGFNDYKFNLATQNLRQGGSSFKTFVLATLMDQGHSPDDSVDGKGPCRFNNPAGEPNPYEADNFSPGSGSIDTIRGQTLRSSNCAYLRLGLIAGLQNVVDMAHKLGIRSDLRAGILSTPLGTQEVTVLDMASAYATLANDGVRNAPYYIERVEDSSGRVLYEHAPNPQEAVSPQTARLVTSVLEQNVQSGTGTAAQLPGRPAAGKTGTAQDSADAWFAGYTPQLATAVWVGGMGGRLGIRLGGRSLTGGSFPARIWGSFMAPWHEGAPAVGFNPPQPPPSGRFLEAPRDIDLTGQRPGPPPREDDPPGDDDPPGNPPPTRPGPGGGPGDDPVEISLPTLPQPPLRQPSTSTSTTIRPPPGPPPPATGDA
jgi:penicillin-binding protein 1A